jgi:hypothetical protein
MPDGKDDLSTGRNKIRVGSAGENPSAGPVPKRVRLRQNEMIIQRKAQSELTEVGGK